MAADDRAGRALRPDRRGLCAGGGRRSSRPPRWRCSTRSPPRSTPARPDPRRRDRDRDRSRSPLLRRWPHVRRDGDRRLGRDDREGRRRGATGSSTAAERTPPRSPRRVRRRPADSPTARSTSPSRRSCSSSSRTGSAPCARSVACCGRAASSLGLVARATRERGAPDDDFDDALEDVGEEPRDWDDRPGDLHDPGGRRGRRCAGRASRTCGAGPASSPTRSRSTATSGSWPSSTRRISSRACRPMSEIRFDAALAAPSGAPVAGRADARACRPCTVRGTRR